jgi:hypothetical protein
MIDILLPSCLLVVLGYALHSAVIRSGRTGRSKSELPVHRRALTSTSSPWTLERNGFTISLSTAGLNDVPSQILDRRSSVFKRGLLATYDFGSLLGVLGGAGAIGVTGWAVGQVWNAVWTEARTHAAQKGDVVTKVIKRAIEEGSESQPAAGLQPLVSPSEGDWLY